jgi:hypothetical protein
MKPSVEGSPHSTVERRALFELITNDEEVI